MSIASMTGFARVNGSLQTVDENISWVWEIKSVNGKSLDIKLRLPAGYDDMMFSLKAVAGEYLARGSVSVSLEINQERNNRGVKIDEDLLRRLAERAILLDEEYGDKLAKSSAAELLAQHGVVEREEAELDEKSAELLRQRLSEDFAAACAKLRDDRCKEGVKIKVALLTLLDNIEDITLKIEKIAEILPQKIKEKLSLLLQQYAGDVEISEDRLAQEVVFLITKADIREEIDRLKAHIKAARQLLATNEAVGRRLDFLCQELNREANTTCSKAADIAITDFGMELKALIEQFREQVQNIE